MRKYTKEQVLYFQMEAARNELLACGNIECPDCRAKYEKAVKAYTAYLENKGEMK